MSTQDCFNVPIDIGQRKCQKPPWSILRQKSLGKILVALSLVHFSGDFYNAFINPLLTAVAGP